MVRLLPEETGAYALAISGLGEFLQFSVLVLNGRLWGYDFHLQTLFDLWDCGSLVAEEGQKYCLPKTEKA